MAEISSRFQHIINRLVCIKYKRFDFNSLKEDKKLTTDEVNVVCSEIGRHIQELSVQAVKFKTPNRILLETIFEHCTNVRTLKLEGFIMKKKYLLKFHHIFVRLISIELRNCPLSDYFYELLRLGEHFRELRFVRNFQFSGKCLGVARNIHTLSLENCKNINPENFTRFCENQNENLIFLNLKKCEWLVESNVCNIVERCPRLERLIISNVYPNLDKKGLNIFGKLRNLKFLEVEFNGFSDVDDLLQNLNGIVGLDISSGSSTDQTFNIISCYKALRVLKVNDKLDFSDDNLRILGENGTPIQELYMAGCCNISNEELNTFVRNNILNLKLLDLSGCYGITDNLIKSIVELMDGRNQTITLIVGGTQISDYWCLRIKYDLELIRIVYENTYDPCEEVDYHIDDNSDDEENYMRLMRRGLLNVELFTSDSDTEDF